MARTSDATLSSSRDRPLSLARYISPSNSSRTGQKSFSKASRLENICISPSAQDAVQSSNERLTTASASPAGRLEQASRIRQAPPRLAFLEHEFRLRRRTTSPSPRSCGVRGSCYKVGLADKPPHPKFA